MYTVFGSKIKRMHPVLPYKYRESYSKHIIATQLRVRFVPREMPGDLPEWRQHDSLCLWLRVCGPRIHIMHSSVIAKYSSLLSVVTKEFGDFMNLSMRQQILDKQSAPFHSRVDSSLSVTSSVHFPQPHLSKNTACCSR